MTTLPIVQPAPQKGEAPPPSLDGRLAQSPALARLVITGLPLLGMMLSLASGLPLFACMMSGCFLLGAALTCRRAMAAFAGKTLRLLVASRVVLVLVLAAVLLCATGAALAGVVSAALLWLVADRMLGRLALFDLWRLVRKAK